MRSVSISVDEYSYADLTFTRPRPGIFRKPHASIFCSFDESNMNALQEIKNLLACYINCYNFGQSSPNKKKGLRNIGSYCFRKILIFLFIVELI